MRTNLKALCPLGRLTQGSRGVVEYVTISIPRPLYERLAKALKGTGYRSPTEYIIFLIRKNLPDLESEDVKRRLKALGYL